MAKPQSPDRASIAPPAPRMLVYIVRSILHLTWIAPLAVLLGYLLWPGHLLPGSVNVEVRLEKFEYRQAPTENGPRRCLFAVVRATNRSGHRLWYRGLAPGSPDKASYQLVAGEWLGQSLTTTPGVKVAFDDGETLVMYEYVRDNATAMKLAIAFGSSWFGAIDHWATSDEWQITDSAPRPSGGASTARGG